MGGSERILLDEKELPNFTKVSAQSENFYDAHALWCNFGRRSSIAGFHPHWIVMPFPLFFLSYVSTNLPVMFPETVIDIGESVRGKDVYVIQTGTK